MITSRALVLLASVLVAGCAVMPLPVRGQNSGTLRNQHDGTPVGGARLTVRSWTVRVPGTLKGRLLAETATITDARGRWAVSSRYDLHFLILAPEFPAYADELVFDTPEGRHLVVPDVNQPNNTGGGLWSIVDKETQQRPRAVTTAGVMTSTTEALAAYYGGLLFLVDDPVRVALRGDVRLGVFAGSAALGLGFLPSANEGLFPLGGVLGYRFLRRWVPRDQPGWLQGPEVSILLLGLRLSVMAEGTSFSTPLPKRHFSFGAGIGYL